MKVHPLLSAILNQTQLESVPKWKMLSKQICCALVKHLYKRSVDLDSIVAIDMVHKLFSNLDPAAVHESLFQLMQAFAHSDSDLIVINQHAY